MLIWVKIYPQEVSICCHRKSTHTEQQRRPHLEVSKILFPRLVADTH